MSDVKNKLLNSRLFSFFDTLYKSVTLGDLDIVVSKNFLARRIRRCRKAQKRYLLSLKNKKRIRVAFFMQSPSVWKYDNLYRLMAHSERYDPIVVISPYNVHLKYDSNECMAIFAQSETFAQKQGYRYITAYDAAKRKWLDVKKIVQPDIAFFCKPYKDTVKPCHLYAFQDILTCYVPYGISCIDIYKLNYNLPFHNLLWRFFIETDFQKADAERFSFCHGDNVVTVGSLGTESLIDPQYQPKEVWKPQAVPKKRIIWAPHHTVDYLFNFSNFLVYSDYMLELATKYQAQVQFAFKPHPVLKVKLFNIWGKEKTEAYYARWKSMENTQIEEGEYRDLFLTSDAMIHDCGSFTAEYLYTGKPVMFMLRDEEVLKHWSTFGRKCYDMHYIGKTKQDIEAFVNDTVIRAHDEMKVKRQQFVNENLIFSDGLLPSERVLKYIDEHLFLQQ